MHIYEQYIAEVSNHIQERWENREKILMDLRILKKWLPEKWDEMTEEALYEHFMEYFSRSGTERCIFFGKKIVLLWNFPVSIHRKRFIKLDTDATFDHKFCQLLTEDIFGDKIKDMKMAESFNEMTRKGQRQDTGLAAYKLWGRGLLMKMIRPEFFICVSGIQVQINSETKNIKTCIFS